MKKMGWYNPYSVGSIIGLIAAIGISVWLGIQKKKEEEATIKESLAVTQEEIASPSQSVEQK